MRSRAYTCSAGTLSIQLPFDLISNLALEAIEAWKSVPRRGLEIGGILWGRRVGDGGGALVIEGFQAVESEHRLGPSYRLSEPDLAKFDSAVHSHPEVLGVFRTHTRPESPFLHEEDVVLFRRYFSGPDGVFLLIHPASSQAEFFVPEGDRLISTGAFPFRAWDLAPDPGTSDVEEAPAPRVEAPAPVPEPVAERVAEPVDLVVLPPLPSSTPAPRRRISRIRVWAAVAAAGFLGSAVVAAKLWSPPPPSAPPEVAEAPRPGNIGLKVERDGESLRFQWDQDSGTIRSADHAKLEITDGNHQSELDLDPAELGSGLLSYWPDTGDVTVKLEVFQGEHTVSEAIHAPAVVVPARSGDADRSMDPNDVPAVPAPAMAPKKVARPVVRSMRTDVTVVAEPVDGSRQRYILSRIPLLRRLKKHPQLYVPPAPVHRVAPSVSAREWRGPDRELPVDVRVSVGQTGRVQSAVLVADGGHDRDLANAALYAARLWDFAPARLGNEKVPGDVVLHFRFGPREGR